MKTGKQGERATMVLRRIKDYFEDNDDISEEPVREVPEFPHLVTPVSPLVIQEASEHADLPEDDPDLHEILNAVQRYVENHEYQNRPGNAFYERLVEEFNTPYSLREPIGIKDGELFFTILAEGWKQIGSDIGLNERQLRAVRDAHQLYADTSGFSEYGPLVNVMAIKINSRRLAEFVELCDIPEEQFVGEVELPDVGGQNSEIVLQDFDAEQEQSEVEESSPNVESVGSSGEATTETS